MEASGSRPRQHRSTAPTTSQIRSPAKAAPRGGLILFVERFRRFVGISIEPTEGNHAPDNLDPDGDDKNNGHFVSGLEQPFDPSTGIVDAQRNGDRSGRLNS